MICILAPYTFSFSCGYIMVRFLINSAFSGKVLIREKSLLENGAYSESQWYGTYQRTPFI